MFLKLCKHEIKCSYRSFLFIYAIILLASILSNPNNGGMINTISVTVFGIMTGVLFVMCIVVIIRNYSNSMFSKNSYLTHTLPVSTTQLLMTKILIAIFWCMLSAIVFMLSMMFILLRTTGFNISAVGVLIGDLIRGLLLPSTLLYMLYMLIGLAQSISIVYLVMNMTHTTYIRRYRGVVGVILYFAIGLIISFVSDLLFSPFSSSTIYNTNVLGSFMFGNSIGLIDSNPTISILFMILWSSLILVCSFFASKYIVDHKLEIE